MGAKSDAVGKWITVKELEISDFLLFSNGKSIIIESSQIEQLQFPANDLQL